MGAGDSIAGMLAYIVKDASHGNRWHRLAEAASGLKAEDLGYKPVPRIACDWGRRDPWPRRRILTPRHILLHVAGAAAAYGDALAPRTPHRSDAEWDAFEWSQPFDTPESVIGPADTALRRLHARAVVVTDDQLPQRCGMWPADSPRLFVLLDGGILHTSWHLGQVALLIMMSHARDTERMARPIGPASRAPAYPGKRNWSDCQVTSRTEACLRLLDAAYRESPWHAIRRMCSGLTRAETAWRPFPETNPFLSIGDRIRHVAYCKVMYANHAFGDCSLDWGGCDAVIGSDLAHERGPRKLLAALDRAQDYLIAHVAAARDDDLDRVSPMHHRVPHTGWQVVASMAQHDAWHGGQISILRDACAALVGEAR